MRNEVDGRVVEFVQNDWHFVFVQIQLFRVQFLKTVFFGGASNQNLTVRGVELVHASAAPFAVVFFAPTRDYSQIFYIHSCCTWLLRRPLHCSAAGLGILGHEVWVEIWDACGFVSLQIGEV